jgi:hypothetical protein
MNKLFKNTLAIVILIILADINNKPAQALDFFFSFNNADAFGVPGTVSGRILGLTNNSTGAASSVIIDSFPDALDDIYGFNVSNDATMWESVSSNSFTVLNGNIVPDSTDFIAFDFSSLSGDEFDGFCLTQTDACFLGAGKGFSNLFGLGSSIYTANQDGFAGVTYTPILFEFRSTLGLVALGGMFAGYTFARKRKAGKSIATDR